MYMARYSEGVTPLISLNILIKEERVVKPDLYAITVMLLSEEESIFSALWIRLWLKYC